MKKGMQLYTTHGAGVICRPFPNRTTRIVRDETPFSEEHPNCANFITLIQVFGDSITKWYVKREKDPKSQPSTVKWMPAPNDFPAPKSASMGVSLDEDDDTKIRFKAAGYYLLLGRVASRLKEKPVFTGIHELISAVQLELRTKGELPLQINPGVVNYQKECSWNEDERVPYNEKMVEYGNINDIVYAETDSYISVKAIGRACFACHGAAPDPFQKIPTQSLSAIRLGDMRVDRYEVRYIDHANNISYVRSIGGSESVPRKGFLFRIEASTGDLIALETCRCIIVGSLPSSAGPTISLLKNNIEIVNSQLCDGGHGSHTLNTVVEFKASDSLSIRKERWTNSWEAGHLAFIVLG